MAGVAAALGGLPTQVVAVEPETAPTLRAALDALLWDRWRIIVEHGAATALAAVASGRHVAERDERVTSVLCGANTDPRDLRPMPCTPVRYGAGAQQPAGEPEASAWSGPMAERDDPSVDASARQAKDARDTDLSLRRRREAQLLLAERLIATAVPGLSMCGSPRMVTSSGAPSSTR